ncbi:MAG: CIA30 family protein [Burkholderiaceae bacterium]|nr:CIA30 family protein [Burkholderiaceae bacterium]
MDDQLDPRHWQIVVDGVMGGRSSAHLRRAGDALRFEGVVRLDHGGGFASARGPAPPLAAGARGLAIRCRGDGHRYRLTAYTEPNGPTWHASFDTRAGEVTEAAFEFPAFRATWRGRPVDGAPLAAPAITRVGVMLTKDGHVDGHGPFAIDLLRIDGW